MATDLAKLVVKLEAESSRLQKGLDQANSRLKGFERRADTFAAKVKKTLGGAFAGLGALAGAGAFVGVTRGMVAVAAESEKLSASLETVTGSATGAEQAFNFIRRFATETPFQVNEIANAFIRLSAYGIEPTDNLLRSLGNTASAMNKTLEQAVEALADAATGEFERLKEFGIKASSEGDRVRFTFRGVTQEVGKNADEITRYLQTIGSTEFAGAMERQVDTLGGAFSNLQDATTRLADKFASETGLAGSVKSATQALTGLINKASELMDGPTLDELGSRLDAINSGRARGRSAPNLGAFYQDRVDEALAGLPGAEGVRARLTQTELELEEGARRVEALKQRLADIPEADRIQSRGGRGRSAAADTPFSRLNKDLDEANRVFRELSAQREQLLEELAAVELQFSSGGSSPAAPAKPSGGGRTGRSSQAQEADKFAAALQKLEDKLDPAAAKTREYLESVDLLNQAWAETGNDRYLQLVEELATGTETLGEKADDTADRFKDLKGAVEGWGQSFADALLNGGRDMGNFADTVIKQLTRIALTRTFDPFFSIFGDFVSSSAGSLFGGFRAAGGPVNAGTSYIVGERGPELFVPGSSGSIVPNDKMGGSSVVVNVINKTGGTQAITREREENGIKMIDVLIEQVKGAIASDISRGAGAVPNAMQGAYGLNRVAGVY